MNDYICLNLTFNPSSTDASDLMAAFLADCGFESFVEQPDGMSAYIKADSFDENDVKTIIKDFPIPMDIKYSFTVEQGKDWNEEWEKNYFKPISIEEMCVIHSSFHNEYPHLPYDIVIDPKMAFGTGHHATTSMMVSQLLKMDLQGTTVTDMGTGTGILAILAAMRGAEIVNAVEIDPAAVLNARENVELNGNTINNPERVKSIKVHEGDAELLSSFPKADIFLANINRNVILADLPLYADAIKDKGTLLLSGFYEEDIPLITNAADVYGFSIENQMVTEGNWASLKLRLSRG